MGAQRSRRSRGRRHVILLATRSGSANGASLNASRLAAAFRAAGRPAQAWSLYSTDGEVTPGIDRCFALTPPTSAIGLAVVLARASAAIVRARPAAIVGFHPLANVVGLLVARIAGTRVRIASQRNPASSQRPLLRVLDRIVGTVGLYTRNVCVSPAVERTYAGYPRRYRQRVRMIWNGVPEAASEFGGVAARERLGLPTGVTLVGSVGRLDPQKNQSVLLDALALTDGAHLVIAGDGKLRPRLLAQAAELGVEARVHLLGNLPGDRVPELLAALDVFAFPSEYEGFGLALVEAMRAGLPCVVSDIDVFRDLLRSGQEQPAGMLVDPGSCRPWADAFARLAGDPALAATLGANAADRSRRFRFEAMAEEYLGLLEL